MGNPFGLVFIINGLKTSHERVFMLLLLLTALWPYYLASSQLFSGKFSTGKDSQVHYNIF